MRAPAITALRVVLILLLVQMGASIVLGLEAPFFADEDITSAVHAQIDRSGLPNSNMSTAGLPWAPAAQYNFSSYLLATKAVLGSTFALTGPPRGDPEMATIRAVRVLCALMTAGAGLLFYLYGRRVLGTPAAVTAIVLFALSPQLFSESLIARPEPFVLLLFAASLYLTSRIRPVAEAPGHALAAGLGVLQGLLLACKATLAAPVGQVALLALLGAAGGGRPPVRRLAAAAGLFAVGAAAGFVAGLPYILVDLPGYLAGIRALLDQYGSTHLPYGRPFEGFGGRVGHGLRLLADLNGVAVLAAAAAGIVLWIRRSPVPALVLCGPALLFIGYFASNPVLFERNFSVYLPVLFLAAGLAVQTAAARAPRPLAAALLAVIVLQPALLWSRLALDAVPLGRSRSEAARRDIAAWAEKLGGGATQALALTPEQADALAQRMAAEGAAALLLDDFSDPYTAAAVDRLVARHGFVLLEHRPSPLADITQSSLHANHAHGFYLLAGPGRNRE